MGLFLRGIQGGFSRDLVEFFGAPLLPQGSKVRKKRPSLVGDRTKVNRKSAVCNFWLPCTDSIRRTKQLCYKVYHACIR